MFLFALTSAIVFYTVDKLCHLTTLFRSRCLVYVYVDVNPKRYTSARQSRFLLDFRILRAYDGPGQPAGGTTMPDTLSDNRIESYSDFWPYYLRAHKKPTTRAWHYAGSTAALACLAALEIGSASCRERVWQYV